MKRVAVLLSLTLLAGCGGSAPPVKNETSRIEGDLQRQSQQIAGEAEDKTGAIERALENQTAPVFENRANPFNDSAEVDAPDLNAALEETR